MWWKRAKYQRKFQAFCKSMLMVFMVQCLLASGCASSASAETMMQHDMVVSHCHDMPATSLHSMKPMPICLHCDAPDSALTPAAPELSPLATMSLLAIIEQPITVEIQFTFSHARAELEAPPQSASLLYTTTRRIRI